MFVSCYGSPRHTHGDYHSIADEALPILDDSPTHAVCASGHKDGSSRAAAAAAAGGGDIIVARDWTHEAFTEAGVPWDSEDGSQASLASESSLSVHSITTGHLGTSPTASGAAGSVAAEGVRRGAGSPPVVEASAVAAAEAAAAAIAALDWSSEVPEQQLAALLETATSNPLHEDSTADRSAECWAEANGAAEQQCCGILDVRMSAADSAAAVAGASVSQDHGPAAVRAPCASIIRRSSTAHGAAAALSSSMASGWHAGMLEDQLVQLLDSAVQRPPAALCPPAAGVEGSSYGQGQVAGEAPAEAVDESCSVGADSAGEQPAGRARKDEQGADASTATAIAPKASECIQAAREPCGPDAGALASPTDGPRPAQQASGARELERSDELTNVCVL